MSMPFFKSEQCEHCNQIDYRNAKLTKMLSWLCNRLDMPDVIRENCELDSWWKDHQRSYYADLRRQAEEFQRKQEIKTALSKLTVREKELLKIQ